MTTTEVRTIRGSLTRRVTTGAVMLLTGLALIGGVLASTAIDLRAAQLRQSRTFDAARAAMADLSAAYVDQETGLRGFVITGDETFLEPYTAASPRIARLTTQLDTQARAVPDGSVMLDRIRTTYADWSGYAAAQIALVRAGRRDEATSLVTTGAGKRRFDRLRQQVTALDSRTTQASRANQRTVEALQRRLVVLLVLSLLIAAAVLVVVAWGLTRWVSRPVFRLAAAARAVAGGDLDASIAPSGAPEIRSLGRDVAAMRDRLLADSTAWQQALQAVEQHGPAVAALLEALAPHTGDIEGVTVCGRIDAAEGLLAGDWYDTLPLPGDRLAVVLGDVAGHGPRSAVLALRLKHALAAALRAGASPGAALLATSRTLADVPPELFATALVVVLDPAADRLVHANAGHPSALLHAGPHDDRRRTELAATGPLLSPLTAGWVWDDAEHPFGPGAALLAVTDGVLEARDADGEQFGEARLRLILDELGTGDGPRLLDGLSATLARHRGDARRRDDQTIVYARRVPRTPSGQERITRAVAAR